MATAYATIADLKTRAGISDSEDDTYIGAMLEAVSRTVDQYTGRRFYTTSSDETRVYTAQYASVFECPDDIISITTLKTDTTNDGTFDRTWAAADFELWPWNAATDNRPYTEVRVAEDSSSNGYTFETHPRGVQVVGKFGYWTSINPVIREVTLVEALRLFGMNEAPSGVVATGEFGTAAYTPALHPTSRAMLAPFVRIGVGAF